MWRLLLLLILGGFFSDTAWSAGMDAPLSDEVQVEEMPVDAQEDPVFADLLGALAIGNFSDKERLIEKISRQNEPHARTALQALLDNRLVYFSDNEKTTVVVVISDAGSTAELFDPVTGESLFREGMSGSSRITINNRLRRILRGAIARIDLWSDSESVRIAAITEMRRSEDAATQTLLRERLSVEEEGSVRDRISVALALYDLESTDRDVRISALKVLSGELGSDVHIRLTRLLDVDAQGQPLEADAEVREKAARALQRIDQRRKVFGHLETLFFGLSFGSVLVLAAIGLAITFGVMGVINMAHGELIMIGAYTSYVVQLLMPGHIGLAIIVAIPAAFLVSGLIGVLIERGVVRFLYGRPLETLLATFGVSLILQQAVRTIFSPLNRQVQTPEWMSGLWQINEVFSITWNRLYILIFMFLVFAALWLVINRTSLGLRVRAVSQNRNMARAMGVRTARVDALTFGLGSGIAGVAGVAFSVLTNVGPNMGQAYIIDSFMVVVFGGVGNLWGTLIGGMTLGVASKFLEPHVGAVMAKILMLVFIILFIQRRKQGLFPQKGRAAGA